MKQKCIGHIAMGLEAGAALGASGNNSSKKEPRAAPELRISNIKR